VSKHRPQRHDAGPAGNQEQWAAERLLPNEIAADRAAQLELVSRPERRQVRRNFPVVEPLNGDHEVLVLRRRRDRVAALRLVAVRGREPHVHVLTGKVPRPVGGIEHETRRACGLRDGFDHSSELPIQSPAYRCSFHGSP